jgi:hypothetical protein
MAITTRDGMLAGMRPPISFAKAATPTLVAGKPQSLFYLGGFPGAGSAPAPGIGGAQITTLTGQIPFINPGAGNTYLARFLAQATVAGRLMLCDRLWHNSGMALTTGSQTLTGAVQIPARDADGTNAGRQVLAALEVSGATGANAPTCTLGYLDQDGNASTSTLIDATAASASVGSFFRFGLEAGDTGIRTPSTINYGGTAWASGTVHLILYRVLAELDIPYGFAPMSLDAWQLGFPRLYDNTCPFLVFIPQTTTASSIGGGIVYSQG